MKTNAATTPRAGDAARPPPDPFLDPWRTARTDAAQQLLAAVLGVIAEHDDRKRARKPDDLTRWREAAEAVVCALALATLSPGPGRLAVPLSHRHNLPARYRRPTQGETLGRLLELLEVCGFALVTKGQREGGAATTIQPTPLLADLVRAHRLTPADFGRRTGSELIVLRRSERKGGKRVKHLIDYAQTAETRRCGRRWSGSTITLRRPTSGM